MHPDHSLTTSPYPLPFHPHSLEFTIGGRDPGAFFPITVSFASQSLFADLSVASVATIDTKAPIPYSLIKSLTPESYLIG